jgi:hypothetical protein
MSWPHRLVRPRRVRMRGRIGGLYPVAAVSSTNQFHSSHSQGPSGITWSDTGDQGGFDVDLHAPRRGARRMRCPRDRGGGRPTRYATHACAFGLNRHAKFGGEAAGRALDGTQVRG